MVLSSYYRNKENTIYYLVTIYGHFLGLRKKSNITIIFVYYTKLKVAMQYHWTFAY